MHSQDQFHRFIVGTIYYAAITVLLSVIPTRAQNPVPPTAREAAASPAFASKLHPATRPAMTKPQASPGDRAGRSSPQGQSYENGPVNGTTDAWTINFGYIVSDTFPGASVKGFDIYVWEFPGDKVTSLDWSVTSAPNGGTVYGSGTVSGGNLTDSFISTNQYGYDIDKISATVSSPGASGTVWLNLQNATVSNGDPVFWDENSGVGCHSSGCPSQAYQSAVGTIPSEAFDINGGYPDDPCFQAGGNLEIIHDFNSKTDGGNPSGGVVADAAGNVYGAMSNGLVYEIASKNQGWVFSPLYAFNGGSDAGYPILPIVGPDGVLYGTTAGGIQNCGDSGTHYCGLIFSLRPAPTACLTALCPWTESVVYQPTGNNDAYNPGSLVFDQAGNLYGTSAFGGANGFGAIFELTPSPGGWTETILYSFTGGSDGGDPNSLVVGSDGNLYGTTLSGGSDHYYCNGCGVVFELVRPPSGDNWTENVVYSFTGELSDAAGPYTLARDSLGNLFGIASFRPEGELFVEVFELSPSGGSWVFSQIYIINTSYDEAWSNTNVAADAAGHVYWAWGHTYYDCNQDGCWLSASGSVMIDISNFLWSADEMIFLPGGTLGLDAHRHVYGTTKNCGKYGQGTVWKVTH